MSKFDPWEHLNISPNADGSINRLSKMPLVPATGDTNEEQGLKALSKDITLDASKKTWLRIYRPTAKNYQTDHLPIIISFHEGGFIHLSIANFLMHEKAVNMSSEIPAIVVAVEYRLAPEHRLPAAYNDAVDSILWVKEQALDPNGERWLKNYGDFSRCYLCGCNSGGNIAFHAALKVVDLNLKPMIIDGIIMNQPMFGGKERVESELLHAADQLMPLPVLDLMWELSLPKGTDRDHRYANPMIDEFQQEKMRSLPRCLIIGFGEDILVDRQQEFVKILVLNGVAVEACFDDDGFHGIDLIDQARAQAILEFMRDFISSCRKKLYN